MSLSILLFYQDRRLITREVFDAVDCLSRVKSLHVRIIYISIGLRVSCKGSFYQERISFISEGARHETVAVSKVRETYIVEWRPLSLSPAVGECLIKTKSGAVVLYLDALRK
jgi:hypothetical protein